MTEVWLSSAEDPQSLALLADYPARFEYRSNNGTCLSARRPLIERTKDGELIAIRFNNRSTAPVTYVPFDRMKDYYKAFRRSPLLLNPPSIPPSDREV